MENLELITIKFWTSKKLDFWEKMGLSKFFTCLEF